MQRFVKCNRRYNDGDLVTLDREYALVKELSWAFVIVDDTGKWLAVSKIDFEEVKYDGVS